MTASARRRHASASPRRISPELCLVTPPSCPRGRREGRVLTSHPRSAARRCSAKEPHSSIQVEPITRPSLRDGRTAYAALSREPNSFWPPSRSRNSPAPRRLTRSPPPQELGRSNDGQDHTVLPYARLAMFATKFSSPVDGAEKIAGETDLSAPFVRAMRWGSRRAIRPALRLSRPTLPRPPQARLAKTTTT